MAQGKPKKWITAQIVAPVLLGKPGIEVVVWDKWGKTRRGTAIVSVGGIRWSGFKMKKPIRISWEELQEFAES
jgi:hypothetical protein